MSSSYRMILYITLLILVATVIPVHAQLRLTWAHNFGSDWGSAEGILVSGMGADLHGDLYLCGTFQGTADFDPGPAQHPLTASLLTNAFIAKYNARGEYIWAKNITSTVATDVYAMCIGSDGTITMVGSFQGTADFDLSDAVVARTDKGEGDIFIASYSTDGALRWVRTMGSSQIDRAVDVTRGANNSVIVAGFFSKTVEFDPGNSAGTLTTIGTNSATNLFFAQYDAEGNFVFVKQIPSRQYAIDLEVNSSSIFISGVFSDTVDFDPALDTRYDLIAGSSPSLFFARYTADGHLVYANAVINAYGVRENINPGKGCKSFCVDADNAITLCGSYTLKADFDPGVGVHELSCTASSAGYMAKYDAQGSLLWVHSFDDDAFSPTGITFNAAFQYLMTGYYFQLCDVDPGLSKTVLTAPAYHMFMAKYQPNGSFISASSYGGDQQDFSPAFFTRSRDIYICGNMISDTCDIDPGSGVTAMTKSEPVMHNIFLARFEDISLADEVKGDDESCVDIRYDPVNHVLHYNLGDHCTSSSVRVLNLLGQVVFQGDRTPELQGHISLQLSAGVYMLCCGDASQSWMRSFIVE